MSTWDIGIAFTKIMVVISLLALLVYFVYGFLYDQEISVTCIVHALFPAMISFMSLGFMLLIEKVTGSVKEVKEWVCILF